MPDVPSGFTQIPTIMLAERLAEQLSSVRPNLPLGSGERAFESCALGRLAVGRQHDLHGLVQQRPEPACDLLDRHVFR